ncbi:c-type cytochrome [Citricoccus sp. GCM10030269]|uniref:c-type cytochrome n=1 Tax=Citricoccus sp. GCM10030269 TaxID=3273388 RepID=UPI00361D5064
MNRHVLPGKSLCRRAAAGVVAAMALVVLSACGDSTETAPDAGPVPEGDAEAGRAAILQHGCASCHTIPGVESASESIGPDLTGFDEKTYIAGQLPNRPEELIRWIQNPQEISPGTAMPNLGVTEQDARDIAAFLYDQ